MDTYFRKQLDERRAKLENVVAEAGETAELAKLLREVDSALERIEKGTYGLCEECHEDIEKKRLIADPLLRFCLEHLTPQQKNAFEEDLKLASRIQNALLPPKEMRINGWEINYYYEPLGPVSGDYCDLVHPHEKLEDLFFIMGDVSGKGVSASMLMSNLHAIFHSIIDAGFSIDQLMTRANRIFCENTMPEFYATLVCGKAYKSGEIEMCNAGHCPPLLMRNGEVTSFSSTGLPLGAFCSVKYSTTKIQLSPGETLLLYTDGLSEVNNSALEEYGTERIKELLQKHSSSTPQQLIQAYLRDVKSFKTDSAMTDDLTIMVIKRE